MGKYKFEPQIYKGYKLTAEQKKKIPWGMELAYVYPSFDVQYKLLKVERNVAKYGIVVFASYIIGLTLLTKWAGPVADIWLELFQTPVNVFLDFLGADDIATYRVWFHAREYSMFFFYSHMVSEDPDYARFDHYTRHVIATCWVGTFLIWCFIIYYIKPFYLGNANKMIGMRIIKNKHSLTIFILGGVMGSILFVVFTLYSLYPDWMIYFIDNYNNPKSELDKLEKLIVYLRNYPFVLTVIMCIFGVFVTNLAIYTFIVLFLIYFIEIILLKRHGNNRHYKNL